MQPEESWRAPRHPIAGVDYAEDAEAERWLAAGAWLPLTLGEALEQVARERPEATAIADETGRISYAELEARSAAAARRLLAAGLEPGDRVLVQVGIGGTAVVALLALIRAGLVPVCAVPQYRAYEMGALAQRSDARGHLVEPGAAGSAELVAFARELRAAHPGLERLVVAGRAEGGAVHTGEGGDGAAPDDTLALEGEDAPAATLPAAAPRDVVTFQLSGGTTGVPKIIPRFHAEYLGYASAWADRIALTPDDVLLWTLPVAHNAGMLCYLVPTLLRGATLVLRRRFEAEDFLATIARERVTVTGSIGPITPRLLDVERPERHDLSSVRLFITLNRAAHVERHLGVRATNMFGITEGIVTIAAADASAEARHETVGHLVSPHDELRILVPGSEQEAAPGEPGELCFRGPSTLRAYVGDAEATARAFTSDGFFRSGDLVCAHDLDDRTHVSFEGRAKDNIDRGGEKFGTEEIEALLAEHPAIQEARVVGMPDPYLGERVCAFAILRPGAQAPSVEQLGAFLLERGLAKFKLPERIEPIAELPVTRVGKLDRAALRARIAETLAAEASHQ